MIRKPHVTVGRRLYPIPWRQITVYLLAVVFALYVILPFYWIVATSFMNESDAVSIPPQWFPVHFTLANYLGFIHPSAAANAMSNGADSDLLHSLLNSAIVAVATTVLNLFLAVLAAYTFARLRYRGSGLLLGVYLASRMVPGIAIIIPFYILMQRLKLLDTYASLILSYTSFSLPFTIWILKDYFRSIPRELDDAARVDRCGWLRMMWSVFIPIAAPGLVVAGVFAFMTSWNEFMFALFLTSTIKSETIPVIAAIFVDTSYQVPFTAIAAAGVVAVVPALLIALVFQRLIVQGLSAGSVKG